MILESYETGMAIAVRGKHHIFVWSGFALAAHRGADDEFSFAANQRA